MDALIAVALGAYIMAEALAQLNGMEGQEKLCRRAKYLFAAVCGLWLLWGGLFAAVSWMAVTQGAALALFLWKRSWARVEDYLDTWRLLR